MPYYTTYTTYQNESFCLDTANGQLCWDYTSNTFTLAGQSVADSNSNIQIETDNNGNKTIKVNNSILQNKKVLEFNDTKLDLQDPSNSTVNGEKDLIRPETTCNNTDYETRPWTFTEEYIEDRNCETCPVGHKCDWSTTPDKTPCPIGKYQDQTGQTSCETPDTGHYLYDLNEPKTKGSSAQTIAPTGSYVENAQRKLCPIGKYQDQTGQTSCETPDTGHYLYDLNEPKTKGSSAQTIAPTGSYVENAQRKLCPIGKYQDQTGQVECKPLTVCKDNEYESSSGPYTMSDRVCEVDQNIIGQIYIAKGEQSHVIDPKAHTTQHDTPEGSGTKDILVEYKNTYVTDSRPLLSLDHSNKKQLYVRKNSSGKTDISIAPALHKTDLYNQLQGDLMTTKKTAHKETLQQFNLYKDGTIKYLKNVNMTHKENDPKPLEEFQIWELAKLENNKEVALVQLGELRHDNRQQTIYNNVDAFKFSFWVELQQLKKLYNHALNPELSFFLQDSSMYPEPEPEQPKI